MFSTISSFRVTETPTYIFTNSNVFLFPNDILADDDSSCLSQTTAPPDESLSVVEPIDSSVVIPSSLPVSPPPPVCRTS